MGIERNIDILKLSPFTIYKFVLQLHLMSKFCIFCGEKPNAKTREHVLPQWLIELTGDPKRIVNMGFDYFQKKELIFDWSNFVFPACDSCNNQYSALEDQIKPIIEKLLRWEVCTGNELILLMDWLDKVRIGLWLGYYYLQKNLAGIVPSFHINNRIRKKDRMLAIHIFDTKELGLNAFGVDTLVFQYAPCCFALKVNSLLLLNISADYIFSIRCGFPGPRKLCHILDGNKKGRLDASDFIYCQKIKHPIFKFPMFKPTIVIYQPIMLLDSEERPIGLHLVKDHRYLLSNLIDGSKNVGILFRYSL